MKSRASNVVLIGMPGSGKSTVGVVLAKKMSLGFVDTDVLIQTSEGRALQDIADLDGYVELRRMEENVLRGLDLASHVIATGGSAVYSEAAMAHLRSSGTFVFLDVDLPTLTHRVGDFSKRGLAKHPNQTFAGLYEERIALYRLHASITIECGSLTQDAVCEKIIEKLDSLP